jgi:L-ascorbate metabolism protein UlaG (beta-lactamase superfamily)
MLSFHRCLAVIAGAVVLLFAGAAAAEVKVQWLGHATVKITSVEGKVIVIDPFLIKNPKTPAKYRDLKALGKVDLILVTHGHGDHIKDLKALADLTGATVVANYEFVLNAIPLGLIDSDKAIGMNKGGTVSPIGRGIKVHMVPAEHSSSIDIRTPFELKAFGFVEEEPVRRRVVDGGPAVGFVIELENGFKVYHSGDTDVFPGMALIHEFYKPDLAMVCISGHFTMDPVGAAYAVNKLLKPKMVFPIHYGTFPVINRTPAEFKAALGDTPVKLLKVEPGQTLKF